MAIVIRDRSGKNDRNLRRTHRLCSSLLDFTDDNSGVERDFTAPTMFRKVISLASVPPANAPPGDRYAFGPIRTSVLRPRSTSLASAPTSSQIEAISLANGTD